MKLADLPIQIHQYIDLVRRLEVDGYTFTKDPNSVNQALQTNHTGSFAQKLIIRTDELDPEHRLLGALTNISTLIKFIERLLMIAYFIFGFVGVMTLLAVPAINFFYVLFALIGWHTLSLILWIFGQKSKHYGLINILMDRLKPTKMGVQPSALDNSIQAQLAYTNMIKAHAFAIHQESIAKNENWFVARLMHQGWLFGLFGTLTALLGMFLFKSYHFVWESTLLSNQHFYMAMQKISYLPSLIGVQMPSETQMAIGGGADSFAKLMIACVFIYAFIPRLIVYLYSKTRARFVFAIDTTLFYYENLHRKLMNAIVDKDDYRKPKIALPPKAKLSSGKKVVASLERSPSDALWYQMTVGLNVTDAGVIDNKSDMERLAKLIKDDEAFLILAIPSHAPPDRGLIKKLSNIANVAEYGMTVYLINEHKTNDYSAAWHQVLIERQLSELRL